METDKTSISQELEVKYFIIHDKPEQIVEKLSKLDQLGKYQLVNPQSKQLHDIYLDTAEETFRQNRLALRLRSENNQHFITVKGKTKIKEWGGIERLEIETQWSREAFQETLLNLENYGINLQVNIGYLKDDNPLESLQNCGLQIIQERNTSRLIRDIQSQNENIAELAIDQVTYGVNNRNLIHYEIEIEAKKTHGIEAIQVIQKEFQSMYSNSLKLAVFSKLTLGMVLQELPEDPQYYNLQKPASNLLPKAYHWIEQKLKLIKE